MINLLDLFTILIVVNKLYALTFDYHNYVRLVDELNSLKVKYGPEKLYMYSIGKSVEQRDLWVVALADVHADSHVPLRPEVKYIANMHGNEQATRELLLHLLKYMLEHQHRDVNVDYVMKRTRLHLFFSMNPDGSELATMSSSSDCLSLNGRFNANGIDLNRDFYNNCNQEREPETKSIIEWLDRNHFVLSANFHSGALVVNYPYDLRVTSLEMSQASIDEELFQYLARNYSFNHLTMRKTPQCNQDYFIDGITKGCK